MNARSFSIRFLKNVRVLFVLVVGLALFAGPTVVTLAGTFGPITVTDQTATAPLANPVPSSFQPRYISGFGSDQSFTVFFEDRDAGSTITYASTTGGPTGFPASATATNVLDTHFVVKDWPINVGGTDYAYRAWGSVGNNLQHKFYVTNDLTNWTLVSTFTIPNAAGFTGAKGFVYYGFHDVIQLNGTYYAFAESNQSQTMIVRSANGDDVWEAFASVGGRPGDGPLELPSGVTFGWTPSGSFVDLGHDRGYGKIHVDPRDSNFYLAVNTAAKPSLSPADLEAAFIDPANWTWHDGTTGPAAVPILSETGEHDLRECWVVPNSDPDADWVIVYDADFGSADGGRALGHATLSPPGPPCTTDCYVDGATGSDANGGASWADAKQTIQAAIDQVNVGGNVHVAAGTYNERLTISKSLQLNGAQVGVDPTAAGARTDPANESIVTEAGLSTPNPDVLIEIPGGVTDVTIDGFTLNGDPTNLTADTSTIRAWDDNIGINNNIIDGLYAVLYKGNDYLTVHRNRIVVNKLGVTVQPNAASNVTISENVFSLGSSPAGGESATYLTSCSQCSVTGNTATGFVNGRGTGGSNLSQLTVSGNTFTGNNDAVSIWGNSTFLTICDNDLSGSLRYGINVKGQDVSIEGNQIDNCGDVGVNVARHVIDTERVTISSNNISGNTNYGVYVDTATVTEIVNASGNWWGAADGPSGLGPGSGDAVSANVAYCPWLDGPYPGGSPTSGNGLVTNLDTGEVFCSIQAAIDDTDTLPGHTIEATAGTYNESVTIDKDNLTVQGETGSQPAITGGVQLDTNLSGLTLKNFAVTGSAASNSIVRMVGAITDLTIDHCVFDGENVSGRLGFSGGQLEGDVTVTHSEFKNILGWALFESKSGSGGDGSAMDTVTFADNYIHDSNGSVVLRGLSTDRTDVVNVHGNTWEDIGGANGETGQHWAALEINRTVAANVYDNTVRNVSLGEWGEGQAFQFWDIDTLQVYGNDILDNAQGIFIYGDAGGSLGGPFAVPGGYVSCNNIVGNTAYGLAVDPDATGGPLNAETNWWGDANGPYHPTTNPGGSGDSASDHVDFDPWSVGTPPCVGTITIVKDADPADGTDFDFRLLFGGFGNISTVAGDGTTGYGGDGGPATSAQLRHPYGVAVDGAGNLYIADFDNHRIRKVDAGTGVISTVAGNGTAGYGGDGGPATSAQLDSPIGVAVDGAGNLYIADQDNHRIRKVDAGTGVISTVAGDGTSGYSGDGGPATSASLNSPRGVAVDSAGDLLIADRLNHRIRQVDATTGVISTVAGDGTLGSGGDGGPATSAQLHYPGGVVVDAAEGFLIADTFNHRIRKVDVATGVISTVAGDGTSGYSGDGGPATSAQLSFPADLAADGAGKLWIAEEQNHCIRQVEAATGVISTVAGDGTAGYSGDGGPATSAQLRRPFGIAVDGAGNLYVADMANGRIRRVEALSVATSFTLDDADPDDGDAVGDTVTYAGLPVGTYTVQETVPDGWDLSGISCVDPDSGTTTSGTTATIDLDPGEAIECTFINTQRLATLGDRVWDDLDRDGVQDDGEPGLPDVIVELYECNGVSGSALATTTTDDQGAYSFVVPAGSYYVRFLAPSGYVFTAQYAGSDPALDSDPDPLNGETVCITLQPGENNLTVDAGLFEEDETNIELISFTATPGVGKVTLAWETGTEVDVAGFNLWRSESRGGPYVRINETLIPAQGDAVSGASYTYVDETVEPGVTYHYRLGDVSVGGLETLHGPVSAMAEKRYVIYLPIVVR